MSYLDTVISHGDAPHETGEPCCVPRGAALVLRGTRDATQRSVDIDRTAPCR
jgi:hypothetical protein